VVAGAILHAPVADRFRRDAADGDELGASKTLRLALLRLGLFQTLPPAGPGRPVGRERYGLVPLARHDLAGSLRVPESAIASGAPVLSVLVDSGWLAELEANPLARGRDWERPAYVALVEDGKLAFASGAGLRLHGGAGRERKQTRGYRLYFRKRYGAPALPGEQLGAELAGLELHRVVLRNRSGLLAGPLALDLMRAAGVPAPRSRAVELYLDGERLGPFQAGEFIDRWYLAEHFGHDDFDLVQTKQNRGQATDPVELGEAAAWEKLVDSAQQPRLHPERLVDLDNLIRWMATILYCGTHDAFQGDLARDRSRPDARWFTIAWDLDASFTTGRRARRDAWAQDLALHYLFTDDDPPIDPRARILRLQLERAPFRRRFAATMLELMNHRFTAELRERRFEHYSREAARLGVDLGPRVVELRDYFARREPELRRQIERHFGCGAPRRLAVRSASGARFEVEGFAKPGFYEGWYLPRSTVEIAVAGESRPRTVEIGDADLELALP
jgi:hypothetical protein